MACVCVFITVSYYCCERFVQLAVSAFTENSHETVGEREVGCDDESQLVSFLVGQPNLPTILSFGVVCYQQPLLVCKQL